MNGKHFLYYLIPFEIFKSNLTLIWITTLSLTMAWWLYSLACAHINPKPKNMEPSDEDTRVQVASISAEVPCQRCNIIYYAYKVYRHYTISVPDPVLYPSGFLLWLKPWSKSLETGYSYWFESGFLSAYGSQFLLLCRIKLNPIFLNFRTGWCCCLPGLTS